MARTLVIVESPAKAKTIGRFLGRRYLVKSSMGHVRDLPRSKFGVDVEEGFSPHYITIRGKGEVLKELRAAAKKSNQVLLASDRDREGEAIAWHLQQVLGLEEDQSCRIEFNEITKEAIQNAVKNPRPIDTNLVAAQQARRILDRLVGYKLSPLLWRKVKRGLSAGRVQSVAVRLICDREEEIQNFQPEEYWSLTAHFPTNPQFQAKLVKWEKTKSKIDSKDEMERVLQALAGVNYQIVSITRKERRRQPSAPFITSTLQQDAYRKLNYTAKKTMMLAQQLYEGVELGPKVGTVGLITYMRTDSTRVAGEAQQDARRTIEELFGPDYLPAKPPSYVQGKKAQDAHEAIRPTYVHYTPDAVKTFLSRDQLRLYTLIWERFLASQMAPALMDVTTVEIKAGPGLFRASGSVVKFPGFLRVYEESREEETDEAGKETVGGLMPSNLVEGQELPLKKLDPQQHFTQPPSRYSEASLVKIMEELGIGRPSTYAPTIETVLSRGYVMRESKQFHPTELGTLVVDLLKEYFPATVDVDFTARMEDQLDKVEDGELAWRQVLEDFYGPFAQVLEKAEQEISVLEVPEEESDEVCDKCERRMVIKMGRFGRFLACPGFPECRNTKPLLEKVGVVCPKCQGEVVVRRSRKGRKFFGCSNYPECDYVSWDKPSAVACPACGQRLVEKNGKKGSRLVCPDSTCRHQEPLGRGRPAAGSNP